METAPKDGTHIIVCSDTGNVWGWVSWKEMRRVPSRWEGPYGAIPFDPIAWMPLPEPPKQTDEHGRILPVKL